MRKVFLHDFAPIGIKISLDNLLFVGKFTGTTVLVCDTLYGEWLAIFGVYCAVAFDFCMVIIKAKMWTSAKVAVEIFHLMAFFTLCKQGTEIHITLADILPPEILYDLLLGITHA